jgi:hypothetical protein
MQNELLALSGIPMPFPEQASPHSVPDPRAYDPEAMALLDGPQGGYHDDLAALNRLASGQASTTPTVDPNLVRPSSRIPGAPNSGGMSFGKDETLQLALRLMAASSQPGQSFVGGFGQAGLGLMQNLERKRARKTRNDREDQRFDRREANADRRTQEARGFRRSEREAGETFRAEQREVDRDAAGGLGSYESDESGFMFFMPRDGSEAKPVLGPDGQPFKVANKAQTRTARILDCT